MELIFFKSSAALLLYIQKKPKFISILEACQETCFSLPQIKKSYNISFEEARQFLAILMDLGCLMCQLENRTEYFYPNYKKIQVLTEYLQKSEECLTILQK